MTANFKDLFTISANTWQAFFMLCDVLLWGYSIYTAVNAWKIRKITPETLIQKIKDSEKN